MPIANIYITNIRVIDLEFRLILSIVQEGCRLLSPSSENLSLTLGDRGNEGVYQFFNGNFIYKPREI